MVDTGAFWGTGTGPHADNWSRTRDGLGWVQLEDGQLVRVGPLPGCEPGERLEQFMADTRFMCWIQRYEETEEGKIGLRPDYNAMEYEEEMQEDGIIILVETGRGRIQSFASSKDWGRRFEGGSNLGI